MLRLLFPLMAFAAAAVSITVELQSPAPDSTVCLYGGCRFEQMTATLQQTGATPAGLGALLREDPSNPHTWATFGEYLVGIGDSSRAEEAFAQALAAGSGLAPVLMRVANFDFAHERSSQGLQLVPRILEQTSDFDEILFSYIERAGLNAADVVGTTIPASPRVARSWLAWTRERSSTSEVLTTWSWMQREKLTDEKAANETTNALWQRKAYLEARQVWEEFVAPAVTSSQRTNLLTNARFETEPTTPLFDWDLSPRPGVSYTRGDGLDVRFLGDVNVADVGVRQRVVVSPGVYRFTAELSAENLTTDQGVYFEIADAEDSSRLHRESPIVERTMPRTTVAVYVPVTEETRVLQVQLRRTPSLRFDNKVAGVLRVHRVELAPVPQSGPAH
ncbi:MAG: hypothetical protein ABMA15_12815 [Vicinamibacterales bacterium]